LLIEGDALPQAINVTSYRLLAAHFELSHVLAEMDERVSGIMDERTWDLDHHTHLPSGGMDVK
jgi:hypothetical protein